MKDPIRILPKRLRALLPDKRGITGLETAIVLIAFVVVSSVFAFAALSTGLFSSDKAKETIQAGLAETRGSMELKGSVIATTGTTAPVSGVLAVIDKIAFQVANAACGNAIDLTPGKTLIKYTDQTQSKMFTADSSTEGFTSIGLGDADSDKLLERGETYEITLTGLDTTGSGDNNLTNSLGVNTTFTLEIIPPSGAVLFIERTTPVSLNPSNFLNCGCLGQDVNPGCRNGGRLSRRFPADAAPPTLVYPSG